MSRHFAEEVVGENRRPDRSGITYESCVRIVEQRRYEAVEGDERVFWGCIPELAGKTKWLKVVTDLRTEVLVTAHKDRSFQRRYEQTRRESGREY